MPKVGSTVTVSVLIQAQTSGLFPLTRLFNSSGIEITTTGITLTHIGTNSSIYTGNFIMPSTFKVMAETVVYSNTAQSSLLAGYSRSLDEFYLENDLSSGEMAAAAGFGIEGLVDPTSGVLGLVDEANDILGIVDCNT